MTSELYYRRATVLRAAVLFLFSLLVFRLWWMQILNGERYSFQSQQTLTRNNKIPARRGVIYDRAGRVLAGNEPTWSVVVIPDDIPRDEQGKPRFEYVAEQLERIFHGARKKEDILKVIEEYDRAHYGYKQVPIIDGVSHETIARIKELGYELRGVQIVSRYRRVYPPNGPIAFHVLGYVQGILKTDNTEELLKKYDMDDLLGKAGLEAWYEDYLRGGKGTEVVAFQEGGRRVIRRTEPIAGYDLYTSIDRDIQLVAERALAQGVEGSGGSWGAAVVMDCNTGQIIAMASYPQLRPEWFSRPRSKKETEAYLAAIRDAQRRGPWENHCIHSLCMPASAFKMVTQICALEEGAVDYDFKALCTGSVTLGPQKFRCWARQGHGVMDFPHALAYSCNVFHYALADRLNALERKRLEKVQRLRAGLPTDPRAAQWAEELGDRRRFDLLSKWARLLGFGQKTGIDLGGEIAGTVPDDEWKLKKSFEKKHWVDGDTYNMAIGQGFLQVTPLQIAVYTAAIANGGVIVVPRIVRCIKENGREVPFGTAPPWVEQAEGSEAAPTPEPTPTPQPRTVHISPETLRIVRQGMRLVVTEGTGADAFRGFTRVAVAGKTGSSEVNPDAWFTCYAPYQSPKVVVVVFIREGGHGGVSAAPVCRKILEALFDEQGNFTVPD